MHKISARQLKRAQARDLIAALADFFPQTFFVPGHLRRPLKPGIHLDVCLSLKGAITPRELANALGHYCNACGYLRSCVAGAARIGLDGAPAGYVTADEAAYAAERFEQFARRTSKPRPAPKVQDKGRIGLADLKAMARARREKGAA
jgi:ProP effector